MTRFAGWAAVALLALILFVMFTGARMPDQHCWDTVLAPATFDFYGEDVPAVIKTQCEWRAR